MHTQFFHLCSQQVLINTLLLVSFSLEHSTPFFVLYGTYTFKEDNAPSPLRNAMFLILFSSIISHLWLQCAFLDDVMCSDSTCGGTWSEFGWPGQHGVLMVFHHTVTVCPHALVIISWRNALFLILVKILH